jgi:hypothetical protein
MRNGVVLAMAGACDETPRPLFYTAGAVVNGKLDQVLKAHHSLSNGEYTGRPQGGVKVWAMPTNKIVRLSLVQQRDVRELLRNGAVSAKGYYSLLDRSACTLSAIPRRHDCAVVELDQELHLPEGQPLVPTKKEAKLLVKFFYSVGMDPSAVELIFEGMGGYRTRGEEIGSDNALQVEEWAQLDYGTWTWTGSRPRCPASVGAGLSMALAKRQASLGFEHVCLLPGFSGGGTYVTVPASAVKPSGDHNGPGKL